MQVAKTKDSEVVECSEGKRVMRLRTLRFSSSTEKRLRQDGFPNGFRKFKFNGRRNRGFQRGDCALRSVSIAHVDRLKKIGAKIQGFPWKEIVRL